MSATILLGGTFDPVHMGHIRSAVLLAGMFAGARVVLVPGGKPPHRPEPIASAADRLAMLTLAIAGQDALSIDDCELCRDGSSYTYDTLAGYRERLGSDASIIFVMGSDAYSTLPTWHRWRELCDLAHLLILRRPGKAEPEPDTLRTWSMPKTMASPEAMLERPASGICHLTLAQMDVSASRIREMLARGESIEGLTPGEVNRYIITRQLYQGTMAGQLEL